MTYTTRTRHEFRTVAGARFPHTLKVPKGRFTLDDYNWLEVNFGPDAMPVYLHCNADREGTWTSDVPDQRMWGEANAETVLYFTDAEAAAFVALRFTA